MTATMPVTTNRLLKWMLRVVPVILVMGLVIWAVTGRSAAGDRDDKATTAAPATVTVQNGETVVTLSAAAQSNIGLAVAPLQAVSTRSQLQALGMVIPVDQISSLRTGYVAAQMTLAKARVNADVTHQEYKRLLILYQDNQNASQKAVQDADAAWRSSQADLLAARQQLALQGTAARLRWGNVIDGWLTHDSPSLERLLSLHAVLVQVTPSPGEFSRPPPSALLQIPGGKMVRASLVSAFTQVDPRIQAVSFLYLTSSNPGLVPGMSVVAHVPTGKIMRGVLVPRSAVVWSQGKAWVYVETPPGQFARREVPTATPFKKGWFASAGFSPGDNIVIRGAQMLLSEELLPQAPAGGGDDDD